MLLIIKNIFNFKRVLASLSSDIAFESTTILGQKSNQHSIVLRSTLKTEAMSLILLILQNKTRN